MERDELMNKARANMALVDSLRGGSEKLQAEREMAAFLDFMHPNMDDAHKHELIRAAE